MIRNKNGFNDYRFVYNKKAMPDFQTWLKVMKLFLLVPSSWRWRWRRWRRGRILVIPFGGDHIIFARYLSRIRSGTREKEHIQNNGHQGQKHFFHFYEILRLNKEVAVRNLPERFCFSATREFWSTPLLFLESGNCKRPFRLLSNGPYRPHYSIP